MNSGKIIIHGDCGDILGYSMRGGRIFIKGDVGYRAGIHMKSFKEKIPVLIIGGSAGNFLGEYMAGGIIIVLGEDNKKYPFPVRDIVGDYVGTGMHGGIIYIKKDIEEYKLGKEVKKSKISDEDIAILDKYISDFYEHFGIDKKNIEHEKFYKLVPYSHRPYGKLYTY
jgi:glutamate synthase domain-containing protein 3